MNNSDVLGTLLGVIIGIAAIVLVIMVWWRIFSKTGHSGALGLLMFVPFVNLIVLLYLAFSEWPIERHLAQLYAQRSAHYPTSDTE